MLIGMIQQRQKDGWMDGKELESQQAMEGKVTSSTVAEEREVDGELCRQSRSVDEGHQVWWPLYSH